MSNTFSVPATKPQAYTIKSRCRTAHRRRCLTAFKRRRTCHREPETQTRHRRTTNFTSQGRADREKRRRQPARRVASQARPTLSVVSTRVGKSAQAAQWDSERHGPSIGHLRDSHRRGVAVLGDPYLFGAGGKMADSHWCRTPADAVYCHTGTGGLSDDDKAGLGADRAGRIERRAHEFLARSLRTRVLSALKGSRRRRR
jgi:hypothetical protein